MTTLDYVEAAGRLQEAGEQAERDTAKWHYAGLSAREVSPLCLPELDELR